MQKALLALLLGSALVLGACGNNDKDNAASEDTKTTDNAANDTTTDEKATTTNADGEKIAKEKCISCHGNDLTGAMGPDLTKIGSTLSESEIKDILNKGKGQMPAKPANGLQSDDEVNAVAKWLSEQK
ncbi:cytochrome c [Rummeliibacillus sp. TYF005]|uniref:cytochrome c551 n=1 Tax=unclassified Rummeliibacillus TaxID=2622809 RepID=UPI000E6699B3|nr:MULTISPECIES: cytochrome c [unclassified Rummeliibacillus]RIJ67940.1 cytochrome c [Rummeliibacillus sp. POC4]RPJ95791.1 cytochrome c [Rummeliibacillus sp. TYF005]